MAYSTYKINFRPLRIKLQVPVNFCQPQCLTFLWDKIFRITGKNLISPGRKTFITAPLFILSAWNDKLRFTRPHLVGAMGGILGFSRGFSGGGKWSSDSCPIKY